MYTNDQNKIVMENKNVEEKRTLESWARKELFDAEEVEGFLQYCEDELFIPRSKMMTERRFMNLMASLGY
jgi:hypothetical protein